MTRAYEAAVEAAKPALLSLSAFYRASFAFFRALAASVYAWRAYFRPSAAAYAAA
jgi:hypothetical protein